MSLKRNFYDPAKRSRNLLTTVTGVFVLVISGLSLFGILTAEQASSLTQYATAIITAVAGIISVFFATDPV